ncbi:MAG: hypothetical protein KatS3mg110_4507 [Pirellulaceae bacterium]|nr:MAG: hypothetical protein KatS3mg110_4507 [Pirellulaceae bacterium]
MNSLRECQLLKPHNPPQSVRRLDPPTSRTNNQWFTMRVTSTVVARGRAERGRCVKTPVFLLAIMTSIPVSKLAQVPDMRGRYGPFGGQYVPETLHRALAELEAAYEEARNDPAFQQALDELLRTFVGRPSPLYFARRLTEHAGGAQIWFKREDLNHTGAHKINNTLGQALLTLRMGKSRVIAETGAGQHGVATATACAHFGLPCVVYMGEEDVRRQAPNVHIMQLLGAEVRPVRSGSRTLRDAINEALRDWMASVETTHYIIGSVVGPHPFPRIVRDFQSVIGREARQQALQQWKRLPDYIVACVGGGSNAAGIFYPFIEDASVRLVGVEAGGRGTASGEHAAPLSFGRPGILHGSFSYVMQDDDGQTCPCIRCRRGWTIRVSVRNTVIGKKPGAWSTPTLRISRRWMRST